MKNIGVVRRAVGFYGNTNHSVLNRLSNEQATCRVSLIGAALGLGAKDPHCSEGPNILRLHHPEYLMLKQGVQAAWSEVVCPNEHQFEKAVVTIGSFCLKLARQVREEINRGRCFTVIGGDHSCAIGTWTGASLALSDEGPLGLIWIDAHLDAHTVETSPSGCVNGMPVASLLGYGPKDLVDVFRPGAKLLPKHLCLIGGRSYEQEEIDLLNKLGVRLMLMEEIHKRGFETALNEALDIATSGTAGFGISIDLDAVHPYDAPAVGTPAPDGIPAIHLINAIGKLETGRNLVGYEIAEFNPRLDRSGRTAKLICELLVAMADNGSFRGDTSTQSRVSLP